MPSSISITEDIVVLPKECIPGNGCCARVPTQGMAEVHPRACEATTDHFQSPFVRSPSCAARSANLAYPSQAVDFLPEPAASPCAVSGAMGGTANSTIESCGISTASSGISSGGSSMSGSSTGSERSEEVTTGAADVVSELAIVRQERDDALQMVQELAIHAAGLLVKLDERQAMLAEITMQRDMLRRQVSMSRAALVRCARLLASGRLRECIGLALAVAGVHPAAAAAVAKHAAAAAAARAAVATATATATATGAGAAGLSLKPGMEAAEAAAAEEASLEFDRELDPDPDRDLDMLFQSADLRIYREAAA